LTLETSTFFDAVALRATGFAAAFFVLAVTFGLVAVFFAATLRAADFVVGLATALAALTRVALALAAGLAAAGFVFTEALTAVLTARFAVFAAGRFAFERVGDRRKPFVRLLLMGGISKGCSPE
jgi:hypothetical protein